MLKLPGGDRRGPLGMGSRTGRRMGYCSGYEAPGFIRMGSAGRGLGRGLRPGRRYVVGRGLGWRANPYRAKRVSYRVSPYIQGASEYENYYDDYENISTEEEKEFLAREADLLKRKLANVEQRLRDLSVDEKRKDI